MMKPVIANAADVLSVRTSANIKLVIIVNGMTCSQDDMTEGKNSKML